MDEREKIRHHLDLIYNEKYDIDLVDRIVSGIEECRKSIRIKNAKWDETDIILITYGDSILEKEKFPLKTLHSFLLKHLKDEISIVHILPFFPYSSDDGFSVIDYYKVDSKLGDWEDIEKLTKDFSLMFDLVINHVSQFSQWFQNYLKNISPGRDYFIEVNPTENLTKVVRPRSLPLLTGYRTSLGEKYVWTTFSADQIDLNFKNPRVLEEILNIFLFYLKQGAKIIRLDAIAFLWKEIGTTCLHLPQTHEIVKLLRTLADYINPGLVILTETNVPNRENLGYFGNGDEANMVYQFSLPPLLLYTLFSGNSEYLTNWAQTLPEIPQGCTYFNFTASHDGIGVRPLEGIIPQEELYVMADGMKSFGGMVSTRQNSDGSNSPYELNITYFDALSGTRSGKDNLQEQRFICSQTIALALKGVPAFYIHSLLAAKNYYEGVEITGMNRSINRRKWQYIELEQLLFTDNCHSRVFTELKRLFNIRKKIKALHPDSNQKIYNLGTNFFVFSRDDDKLISISNITSEFKLLELSKLFRINNSLTDILTSKNFNSLQRINIAPYQTLWLKK